jgi:hypothetical protein
MGGSGEGSFAEYNASQRPVVLDAFNAERKGQPHA